MFTLPACSQPSSIVMTFARISHTNNNRGLRSWLVAGLSLIVAMTASCNRAPSNSNGSLPEPTVQTLSDQKPAEDDSILHVYPGDEIQSALDRAASDEQLKTVVIHAGTYRPKERRQSLIWFNRRHDGLRVFAEGDVTLTSANPDIADPKDKSYPAVANHVVYFGDGIGPTTEFAGFKITGANNFVVTDGPVIEPTDLPALKRTAYFYFDGGGIKIYGRSYPTLERLEIYDNYSSPCGAGISVEHRGFTDNYVTIRDCVFRNNRVPLTGAALDLLGLDKGSAALVENCLFVNNASNGSMDRRSLKLGTWMPEVGHGAITLFRHSKATFRNCTITSNRNGVDDLATNTTYERCIFWNNTLEGGWPTGARYETAVSVGSKLTDCFIGGGTDAQRAPIEPENNVLDAPNPEFAEDFSPSNPVYDGIGYRPTTTKQKKSANASQTPESIAAVPAEPMRIRARGNNFNWYFHYAGLDGIANTDDDICTKRHLYLPVGRTVHIALESDDFLYSLKLPAQGANEIAIPGRAHSCTIAETECGSYPLKGDQFCGYTHPNLVGRVIVQSPSQFLKSLQANQITF